MMFPPGQEEGVTPTCFSRGVNSGKGCLSHHRAGANANFVHKNDRYRHHGENLSFQRINRLQVLCCERKQKALKDTSPRLADLARLSRMIFASYHSTAEGFHLLLLLLSSISLVLSAAVPVLLSPPHLKSKPPPNFHRQQDTNWPDSEGQYRFAQPWRTTYCYRRGSSPKKPALRSDALKLLFGFSLNNSTEACKKNTGSFEKDLKANKTFTLSSKGAEVKVMKVAAYNIMAPKGVTGYNTTSAPIPSIFSEDAYEWYSCEGVFTALNLLLEGCRRTVNGSVVTGGRMVVVYSTTDKNAPLNEVMGRGSRWRGIMLCSLRFIGRVKLTGRCLSR
ncbi:hypothetical protein BJ508DRAFT_343767 [Ascobolus immersus RN42]|uniref:Uncharacterized protein n=1 Tax=Ascobolus immersus RN42 TaxID=1160509 RepID=A0A3N4HJ99_ASCIM|nr:hypothetical protein BJ508DRAFT_343767 [Ascobolus immersus RN42]